MSQEKQPPKEEIEEMHAPHRRPERTRTGNTMRARAQELWCKEAELGKKAQRVCEKYEDRRAREKAREL